MPSTLQMADEKIMRTSSNQKMEITPAGTAKVNVDVAMSVNASILRVVVQDEMQSVLKLGQRKV